MQRVITIVISCVVMLCALPAIAGPYKQGDRVLAQYKGGEYWYVGKVTATKGGKIEIAYLDGASEALPSGHVRAFDWKVGTKVICNFKRKDTWYPGAVASIKGEQVKIKYDDGDVETTTLAYCRAETPVPAP